ncbi:hypothetical protein J32TS2_23250 [Shouchella clausii]|nr:hypothetical protein J1TS1_37420 [Shouchella clausii]GIN16969.1 hypothetical protein J32TS2_23250 [Shouchella clausii]
MEWGYRLKARRIIKKDLICVKDSSQQAYLFLISDMLNIFTMLAFTALCIASLIVLGFLGGQTAHGQRLSHALFICHFFTGTHISL